MAIAFGTSGTAAVGTTSLAVPHPSSVAAGDLLILAISNKYPTNGPATPAGWTAIANNQANGGAGAAGIDTGSVYTTVFYKVAVGGETGNVTVTITSGNAAVGRMFRYTKSAAATWDIAMCQGADNTAGTAWSVTGNANPGITAGDMVIAVSGINADAYTYSAQAISASGVTAWGTVVERQDSGTTQGQDCHLVVSEHPVTTGTATAAPVFTMTASGSATNAPAGGTVMMRLRQIDAITLPFLDESADTFFDHTISPGPVSLTAPFLDESADDLFAPTVSGSVPSQDLTLPAIPGGEVLYSPSVTPGAVSLSVPALTDGDTLHAPTIAPGPVSLSVPLLSSTGSLFAPTVNRGPVSLSVPLLVNAAVLYSPSVAPGPVSLSVPLLSDPDTLHVMTVSQPAVSLSLPSIPSNNILYAPSVLASGSNLLLPLLEGNNTLHSPSVQPGAVSVGLPSIGSNELLYTGEVTPGAVTIAAPFLPGSGVLYPPSIEGLIAGTINVQPATYVIQYGLVSIAAPTVYEVAPQFNVIFNLAGTVSLILQASDEFPLGGKGIFNVTQPDKFQRIGSLSSPDVTSPEESFSLALRLDSMGAVQNGTYTIEHIIERLDGSRMRRAISFVMNYNQIKIELDQEFDVFTPDLKITDTTDYQQPHFNHNGIIRQWNVTSLATGAITGSSDVFDLAVQSKYYDSVYTGSLTVYTTYTHNVYSWLKVAQSWVKQINTYAQTPPPVKAIIELISDLRDYVNSLEQTCEMYKRVRDDFEYAVSLLSHIIYQIRLDTTDNIQQDLIRVIRMVYQYFPPTYIPKDAQIFPYDLSAFWDTTIQSSWGLITGNIVNQSDLWSILQNLTLKTNYVHVQPNPATTWVISHNMGKLPSVTIVDTADDEVEGDVTHDSNNQVTIRFSAPVAGKAFIN